jgi:hypothetical protein
MKWCVAILLGTAVALAQSTAQSRNQRQAVPPVLISALSEVKAKSRIPVLLPSELPQPLVKVKYASVETASADKYAISLYYELGVGDAGFAASFMAEAHPGYGPKDIPNVSEVKLSRGIIGYFRPVSCGGSCAPANLWWEEDQALYLVQLKLSSTLSEHDQQREMIAIANSAILAGAR